MPYRRILLLLLLTVAASISPLRAIDTERDFSGKWILDQESGASRRLPAPPEANLTVVQDDGAIKCSTASAHWTYKLDGNESHYQAGDSKMNSVVKWEGAALLINTLVS